MTHARFDVTAVGNAIVDVIARCDEAFLVNEGLTKGSMQLVSQEQSASLYTRMGQAVETSGGSAGNTVAGVASLGGRAAFIGKVADDQLGEIFAHDIQAIGVHFDVPPLIGGPSSGRSLINVTPDGQRTMCTFLGAANELTAADIEPALIEQAAVVYMEGYLFDLAEARRAFAKAAGLARANARTIAFTLSDGFMVDRHREALREFVRTQVDLLFANESELLSLCETDDFNAALQMLGGEVKIAAVTRGEKGSVIVAGDQRIEVKAAPLEKVVDTTGAGDQYAAGFLFGLAQGRPLEACARLGGLAAAEVISHVGPRPQVSLKDLMIEQGL
jgi:sugar/nucleoside kinase (ribokinase family)